MRHVIRCVFATAVFTIAVLFSASRSARAQYNCSSGKNTACLDAVQTGSGNGLATGTAGGAGINSADTGSGYGAYLTSMYGAGIMGIAGANTALSVPPAESAGVIGSGTGSGVFGVYAAASGADGMHAVTSAAGLSGACGINNANSGSGSAGVAGYGWSPAGSGVFGQNNAAGYGVQGVSGSSGGTGVYGSGGTYGVYGAGADYGVYGSSSANYGVWGEAPYIGVVGEGTGVGGIGVFGNGGSGSSAYGGYFLGNTYTTGTYSSSDARLKKNVRPMSAALSELLQLKGVTFEWINPEEHAGQTGLQRGFIAQDVEKVFPGWISVDRQGFKTLSVGQVEALEVESIRALKVANDELRDRVMALENGTHPIAAGVGFGGRGWELGGLVLAAVVVLSRRRRSRADS
jgi:hypothetical protein